jgi:hypothetical protein
MGTAGIYSVHGVSFPARSAGGSRFSRFKVHVLAQRRPRASRRREIASLQQPGTLGLSGVLSIIGIDAPGAAVSSRLVLRYLPAETP